MKSVLNRTGRKGDLEKIRNWIKSCNCRVQLKNAYGAFERYLKDNNCEGYPMIVRSIEDVYQKTKLKLSR